MHTPTFFEPQKRVAPDTDLLPGYFPAPGFGIIPVNAFLIHSAEPVLVDTGLIALQEPFIRALSTLIPLESLRWIWLTHVDFDHIGSLGRLLTLAPQVRIATTFLAMAKLSLFAPPPPDRVFLLNPGQSLAVGDRSLVALRPPTFDAPETMALFDGKTRTLFSADSFGALLQEPAETAEGLSERTLHDGVFTWATIDAPWLQVVDVPRFEKTFDVIRDAAPETLLSSHLPPAHGITAKLLTLLASAHTAPPFVGPDQATFTQMMSQAAE